MSRLHPIALAAALLVCAALYFAARWAQAVVPADPRVPVVQEGAFAPNGEFPGEPLSHARGVRLWGSWAGNDDNRGALAIGPFRAESTVCIGVTGYPTHKGISIRLQLFGTAEMVTCDPPPYAGERWRRFDIPVPPAWVGRETLLIARDDGTGFGGWIGISEPLRARITSGVNALLVSLSCWAINGVALGLLVWAAARECSRASWIPSHWLALVAAAMVATTGYAVFWAFFAHPGFGRIVASLLLVGAGYLACRRTRRVEAGSPDLATSMGLCAVIGLFYLTLLHLYPSAREYYNLAANRIVEGLPGDNTLPHNVAMSLFKGENLRPPGADWLTSDRPPLQSGWLLLPLSITQALGLDETSSTGTAALWMQLLWIPAAFGLFRTFGMTRGRAAAWIIVLALSGFFLLNSVFTWPKLSAAAFGCGAFALWFLSTAAHTRGDTSPAAPATPPTRRMFALGAALAGLAWLSHGGIAFSFIPLIPWIVWRMARGEAGHWLLAAAVFAALAFPWFAFQKWYNPPGDRLIKMHLAGHPEKDDSLRAFDAIRSAYAAKTRAQIIAAKLSNVRMQTLGHWPRIVGWKRAEAQGRRNDEFFSSARALGWWTLGAVALPLALLSRRGRQLLRDHAKVHAALVAWTLLTMIIWCLLMFDPYTAIVHQGSYAMMLGAFVLLSAWLDAVSRAVIWLIAALQLFTFVSTWAGPNQAVNGSPTGWPFLAVSSLLLAAFFVRATRDEALPAFGGNETPAPKRP